MKNKDILWEEFSNYLDISINSNITPNIRRSLLIVESANYSSFPNGMEAWLKIYKYCADYIKNNEPTDYGDFGKLYIITPPEDLIDFCFWEKLKCRITLCIKGTATEQNEKVIESLNLQRPIQTEEEVNYILENGKTERVKIQISNIADKKDLLGTELAVNFFHEMLHAYEDYSRIVKKNKTIEQYKDSTNYYDIYNDRKQHGEFGWFEENKLRNLFHFFNKTEQRALVSSFYGEIISNKETKYLSGVLDNTEEIIKSTKAWKTILDAQEIVEEMKNCQDKDIQQNLITIYNKHNVKRKVNNYQQLLKDTDYYFWNTKRILYKRFSKIMGDIFRENNKHVMI